MNFAEYVLEKWLIVVKFPELENLVGKIMYTDPIADILNRIRTAQMNEKEVIEVPFSRVKHDIMRCMEEEGFIDKVAKKKKQSFYFLRVTLKYNDRKPVITEIKRISSPGQRIYRKKKELKGVKGGLGVFILSTPKGIMTHKEAKKRNLGGEVLCEIW